MSMKFGLLIDVDFRKRVPSSNTKPEVVWSRRGRHLTPPRVSRLRRNVGTRFRIARKLLRSGQNRQGKKNGGSLFFQIGNSYISAVE